jgi:hypothetical protein
MLLINPWIISVENWIQGEAHMKICDAPLEDVREIILENAYVNVRDKVDKVKNNPSCREWNTKSIFSIGSLH